MGSDAIAIPIIFTLVLGVVFMVAIITRHRERISMVERGLSSEEIKAMYTRQLQRNPLTSLKWGIVLVMAGTAILLGNYLREAYGMRDGAILGLVALLVGVGLVIFYAIAGKKITQVP
jgi:hypothetical protein